MRESVLWQLPPTNFASLNGTVCQKKKEREKKTQIRLSEKPAVYFSKINAGP